MDIRQNEPLSKHSTMRLGGTAAYAVDVHARNEVQEAAEWAEARNLPVLMIGAGSNIVWRDDGFPGLLIINQIMGYEEQQEDGENCYIAVGAGENWDSIVARAAAKGLTGIEALSLIPGTAGATPVQNVGAYGQEIAQTLVGVEAYDRQTKQIVNIQNIDCGFGYRTSRFKTTDRGRFFITAITLLIQATQNGSAPVGFVRIHGIHLVERFAFVETALGETTSLRRGWGVEATRLALAYAMDTLDLHRVEAKVYAYNVLSINALRRNGFHLEGTLREARSYDGRRWDVLVYSILESEMRAQRARDHFAPMGLWPADAGT